MITFLEKFVAKTKTLVVGDPLDPNTNVGSLISEEHFNRVKGYIELAKEEGGTILTGGKTPAGLKMLDISLSQLLLLVLTAMLVVFVKKSLDQSL